MELTLLSNGNTAIKVSMSELQSSNIQKFVSLCKPIRESNNHKYYEVQGDLLNTSKREWLRYLSF